jgi:UDP-glucose 4-epimerase
MHYLITGGAGFIGSHLADALAESHEITILDNLSSGNIHNIRHLLDDERCTFVEGSFTDEDIVLSLCEGIDGIFHLGALTSVQQSVEEPRRAHEVNIGGTLNLLLAAREHGVRKMVLASTAALYGNNPTFPKTETMLPEPLSPYAVSKLTGEYYCSIFSDLYGVKTTCLRFFNVFGPRQDPHSDYAAVIPIFITRLLDGKPLTIFGDGEQTRDFIFVKDVVAANIRAMESDVEGVFNIARGERTSLNELASVLMDIVGSEAEIVYEAPRAGDVRHSMADVSKAREQLGFSPSFSIREGLEETVGSFRSA